MTAVPGAPRHPDFVFPAAAAPLAPRDLQDLEAAWQALQSGDGRGAERRYKAVLQRAPAAYPAHAGLGYLSLTRKDYDDALEHFDRALGAQPAYAPALAGKGQTYLAMDDRAQALASFDAALAADPGLTSLRSTADVLRFQGMQGSIATARKAAEAGRLAEARTGIYRGHPGLSTKSVPASRARDGRAPGRPSAGGAPA